MANGNVTGKAFDLKLFKRVMRYVGPYRALFYFTATLTIVLALLSPLRPWLIQMTVDDYIMVSNYEGLQNMVMLMVALLVVEALVQFFQTYLANWLGQSVIRDLRVNVYHHISDFRLKYFDQNAIGTLVTRTISDIETIADIFAQGILIIIGDLLKLFVVILFMFFFNWRLTLITLVSLPFLIVATNMFKNAIKSAFQDVRTQVSRLNAFVQEHITGMNIVQIFNREEIEYDRFKAINKLHRNAHIRTVIANAIFFPVVEILSALSLALLVWWGSKEVLAQRVELGHLMAFILFIYMLFRPIRQLADRFNVLQMGMVASDRVFKVLDTDSVIEDHGNRSASTIQGNISFRNVWFAYNEEDWVLKDISLEVEQGQTIAFVGATGAGKTSIINLLSRFYEYNKGNISIDGTDLRAFRLNELRAHIGVVLQDVFLFSDSIHNNITLQNPDITREQVIEAAKIVGAHEFIQRLPGNYDYNVKERGAMLSVGQRQLIAFIRAYVYNPRVLVLDEATSSVDTESEELIQNAIARLTEIRTSIVIAHRLATIQQADTIIVLDAGRIIEKGNHQELLRRDGAYKRLYELQFTEAGVA
ncbi:MAG: ABC transporter ATP-binding protein [Salibacteraceae bacterium]